MEIPTLIIVNAANGQQTSENGQRDIQTHRENVVEQWDKAGAEAAAGGDGAAAQ